MPEPLHAPPPPPPARHPPAPVDDDGPEGPDLLDDADEGEAGDDDLGLDWPDDDPLPEDWTADLPPADDDPMDDGNDAPDDDSLPEEETDPPVDEPMDDGWDDPVVVSWRTTATVNGHPMPAVLEPSRERTVWLGGVAGRVAIRLEGTDTLDVDVDACPAETPSLRIGRDVLAGRVLVAS